MRCLGMVAVLLCACASSFGAINWDPVGGVLTYTSPADLGGPTAIDPAGLNDVAVEFGVGKAAFQALNPQVVGFNPPGGAPTPTQKLKTLVVSYSTTGTVTFTFPAAMYNYGSYTSYGRGAFSGSSLQDAISTVPTTADNGSTNWFDARITTTGGAGVKALGFCAAFRNDQTTFAGKAYFTLDDGTVATIDPIPALGKDSANPSNPEYAFIGFQAPDGRTIARVEVARSNGQGGAYVTIDDLAFVMSQPPRLIGDINGDGVVNVGDLQQLVATWASTNTTTPPSTNWNAAADLTGDGYINVGDLQLLVAHWGEMLDTTPPAAVTNLAVGNPTANSLTLTWTAPGDDGSTGTAASYDIRYRTGGAITDSNWASATQVTGEPVPAAAGTNQSMVVTGLLSNTTYYFAIKTADEVPNTSAISNSPSGTTAVSADTTAPAAVTNLAASNPTGSSVTLTWTAPGDDGNTGTATTYDIRYSTSTINAGNFSSATQVTGAPAPQVAGTNQSMIVNNLAANTTYYFAMKTADEVPNWSGLSNVSSIATVAATDANIAIATGYDDAWETGTNGWVQHCKNLRSAWVNKSDGFVLQIGDSITYASPYGAWARSGSGKTAADTTICNWMQAGVWGSGSNNSTNGWYLAAWDVSGRNGSFTAKSSMRADQFIAGNYSLPSVDQMFTSGFTNPDGKQYRDAQICVLMLGTNDAGASRTSAAFIADLDTIIRGLEAADIIVAVSTLPPRSGSDTIINDYNTQIRALAQAKRIPLIDFYQEIVRRRPNGTWMNTLISSDGVHPSADYGGYTSSSDPYASSGAALSNSGYLLRDWLTVQKINEIKTKVYTTATTWNVSTAAGLQSAAAGYAAGDTIVVAAGTYYPSPRLTFNRGGVTIRGATGNRDDVILSGPGMLVSTEPTEMLDVYSDDVTIKDLTVKNVFNHGVHVRGEVDADHTHIQNVKIIDCGERFIKGSSDQTNPNYIVDNLVIENCYLEQITPLSGHSDNDYIGGIDMMGLNNPTIRDCTIKNIRGASGGGRGGIFLWQGINNPTVERNTFIGCDRGLCIGNPSGPTHTYMPNYHSTSGIIRNNMVTRGADIAMELCYTKDLKVYYNTIYSADASYSRTVSLYDSGGHTTNLKTSYNIVRGLVSNTTTGGWTSTGDITGSTPATNWFVDPTNGNLHLTSSATAAFNIGVLLLEVPTDFDTQTRSSTPDIGADETSY